MDKSRLMEEAVLELLIDQAGGDQYFKYCLQTHGVEHCLSVLRFWAVYLKNENAAAIYKQHKEPNGHHMSALLMSQIA
jgi:hypothetical protein